MYSLEQLMIFVTAYEQGSLSEAARFLKRAQSSVSQAMSNLEIELNQTLFIREKTGLRLTSAGQALLPQARQLLRQAHYFDQQVLALERQEETHLTLAIEESLWSDDLLQALASVATDFPQTRLELLTAATYDIEQMIADGQIQLGIIYKDYDLAKLLPLDFRFLGYTKFITLSSPQHPLAQLSQVSPENLMQYLHLVHRSLNGKELWFANSYSEHCWYANDHHSLRQLCLQHIGWADLPEKMAQADIQAGRLVRLPLTFEPDGNLISVVGLRSRSHSHGVVSNYLLGLLKQFFSEMS